MSAETVRKISAAAFTDAVEMLGIIEVLAPPSSHMLTSILAG
jgi:hypothetical protein